MTGEGIILYYNRLNGNTALVETLKSFHRRIQSWLDSTGSGAYVPEIKGIYEKVTKAIKAANGYDLIGRIELKPIKLISKKTEKKNLSGTERILVGEISEDIAKKIKRQKGNIFLDSWGIKHIQKRHKKELEVIGLTAEEFVKIICLGFNEIRQGDEGALFLVISKGINNAAVVKLVRGDFYSVYTAFPMRTKALQKRKLLWSQTAGADDTNSSLGAAFHSGEKKSKIPTNSVCSHKSLAAKIRLLDEWLQKPATKLKKHAKNSLGTLDEDLKYGLERDMPGGELSGLGFTQAGQQKIYDMITSMVLKAIQSGKELPWRKPWTIERILATNFKTKTVYKGANLFLLNLIAPLLYGKSGPYWLTYKQAKELGGHVKEGAEGFPVIFYNTYYSVNKPQKKTITEEEFKALSPDQRKEREAHELWTINYYNVFSQEDIGGIKFPAPGKKRDATPIETAQQIVDAMPQKPEIMHHDIGRAFYSPAEDHIKLPPIGYFEKDQEYYSTLFHELVHSTGHKKRLDRFETNKKISPDNDYAFEELIAELGASYLNAQAGTLYFTLNNSATYLKGWQKKLEDAMKGDNKFFLKASSKAAKAADFILDVKEEKTEVTAQKRESKSSRPPVERKERSKATELEHKPVERNSLAGFTTADKAPATPADLFTLPGEIGKFLGELQRYKLEIVIAGETHSSKSELGKQIADACISHGLKTCLVDWEGGGLESRDTIASIERNIKPENKSKLYVSSEVPRTIEAIKELHNHFDVVILDSGTKLNQVTNAWIDDLREEYPETIWVILMQQNTKGGTRGGTSAEFDAPIVIYTYRPDQRDQLKNYALLFKNRSNKTGLTYNIAKKKIFADKPDMKAIVQHEKKAA